MLPTCRLKKGITLVWPKGKICSQETREKLRLANLGKKQSAETCAKRGAALKGRVFSPEHRARISAALTGKRASDETRARMRAGMKGRPGHPMSDENKAALSRANKGRALSAAHRAKLSAAKTGKPGPWLGKKRGPSSAETKARQSASLMGNPCQYPMQRFYYAGVPFRSTYEVRAAQAFDRLGMAWQYEPQRFDCGDCTYLPDFYLTDEGMYAEVKGYYGPDSAVVMSRMFAAHPDVPVAILQRKQLEELERVAAQMPPYINNEGDTHGSRSMGR